MNRWNNLKRLLAILKDGHWHSGDELAAKVSLHFRQTIHKARKIGYQIETRQIAYRQFEFRLLVA